MERVSALVVERHLRDAGASERSIQEEGKESRRVVGSGHSERSVGQRVGPEDLSHFLRNRAATRKEPESTEGCKCTGGFPPDEALDGDGVIDAHAA
jgi:hypothetical protein